MFSQDYTHGYRHFMRYIIFGARQRIIIFINFEETPKPLPVLHFIDPENNPGNHYMINII
ncbi:MAG: hypothetical protein JST87_03845 [Bacteroidetes bacterium]|nr:hypothetical protein [Bacteroidota bacterium]MBS1932446.1 hypothetical protein [Bacteroidota bacterium]